MNCEHCHEREATAHWRINLASGDIATHHLCHICCQESTPVTNSIEGMLSWLLEKKTLTTASKHLFSSVVPTDPRFPAQAFALVSLALMSAQKLKFPLFLPGSAMDVSPKELLDALRRLVVQKYGKKSKTVLAQWSIKRTEDFGAIVFKMVEAGHLRMSSFDSNAGFENGFDFDVAFPEQPSI